MNIISKYKLTLLGLALGLVGGYIYYYFVGCQSGTCAITSSPVNSTIYGGFIGSVLLNIFEKDNTKKKESNN
jgi:CRISPR/Cas system endoribonuclease Cas6 (RAMP superfamily)